MKILNQKQLNISLLLLFLACTANSFGMQRASNWFGKAKARLSVFWFGPRLAATPIVPTSPRLTANQIAHVSNMITTEIRGFNYSLTVLAEDKRKLVHLKALAATSPALNKLVKADIARLEGNASVWMSIAWQFKDIEERRAKISVLKESIASASSTLGETPRDAR